MKGVAILAIAGGVIGTIGDGETSVTEALNQAISKGTQGVFRNGGKGVLIRSLLDGLFDKDITVVPASYIHNDIIVPSPVYPGNFGSVWCPNSGSTGYSSAPECAIEPTTGFDHPWNFAQIAVVISSGLSNLFPDFDNIQTDTWGWSVFYATDSNSVDQRCIWLEQYNGWDCPGGWIAQDGTWTADSTKKGAGYFPAGNIDADSNTGGGSGCHFAPYEPYGIEQTDAYDADGNNLVGDMNCQCNYAYNGDWDGWVTNWLNNAQPKSDYSWQGWFKQGKAPSFALDFAACWVNNPRDMISLQNAIWKQRESWSNQMLPHSQWSDSDPASQRRYWGWNEVPVDRETVDSAQNWDTLMIKLPAALSGSSGLDNVGNLSISTQEVLESDLSTYIQRGFLVPGYDNAGNRPGSYTVFLRDSPDAASGGFTRTFFCGNWTSPKQMYNIVHKPISATDSYGACYTEDHTIVV
jgi:hypothetical protein